MLSPLDPFIQLIRPICIHNVFAKVMNNNNSLFMQPVGYIEHLSLSLSRSLSCSLQLKDYSSLECKPFALWRRKIRIWFLYWNWIYWIKFLVNYNFIFAKIRDVRCTMKRGCISKDTIDKTQKYYWLIGKSHKTQ